MIRIILLALATTPALASNCPVGQQHVHGVCTPIARPAVQTRVAAPAIDPMAPLPPTLSAPGTLTGTRFLSAGSLIHNATGGIGIVTRPRDTASGVAITDLKLTGATYLLRTYAATDMVPSLTISRVDMEDNAAGGILVRGASSGSITDLRILATRPNTDCTKAPEGIALAGKDATDSGGPWTITRVHIDGIRSSGCPFEQGDGIAVERLYHDIAISYAYAGHNSDAGFDIKSPTAHLDHVVSDGNRRGYKMWADQTHGTLTCLDNGGAGSGEPACIQVQGARTIHIAKLIDHSVNGEPVIEVENAGTGKADVTIDACDLALKPGTKMLVGAAVLHLGPGC